MNSTNTGRSAWVLMLCAAAILMITMGARQSTGLFVAPLNQATGLGIVSISFALAIGQFIWGLAQPIFGAIADKKGSYHVLVFGAILLAGGLAATPWVNSEWPLILTMGILSAAGAGAGSFSILIGATAQQLPPERRAFAGGFINAGWLPRLRLPSMYLPPLLALPGWPQYRQQPDWSANYSEPVTWPPFSVSHCYRIRSADF